LGEGRQVFSGPGTSNVCGASGPPLARSDEGSDDAEQRLQPIDLLAQVAAGKRHGNEETLEGNRQSEADSKAALELSGKAAETVIIFDWDDTLLPTWHLVEVVRPCIPDWEGGLEPDSPFRASLQEHARTIRKALTAARAVAHVVIVTLAMRPWVDNSAKKYLPDLDLPGLLAALEIPVYYAREHVSKSELRKEEEGVDMLVIAKRNAMCKCLKRFRKKIGADIKNVVCIGDSVAEHNAIQEVLWSFDEGALCKTVKLASDPSLVQLMDELELLIPHFQSMVSYEEDLHINMEQFETFAQVAKVASPH